MLLERVHKEIRESEGLPGKIIQIYTQNERLFNKSLSDFEDEEDLRMIIEIKYQVGITFIERENYRLALKLLNETEEFYVKYFDKTKKSPEDDTIYINTLIAKVKCLNQSQKNKEALQVIAKLESMNVDNADFRNVDYEADQRKNWMLYSSITLILFLIALPAVLINSDNFFLHIFIKYIYPGILIVTLIYIYLNKKYWHFFLELITLKNPLKQKK